MAAYPYLRNAPVVEAIIEIRARMPSPASAANFDDFRGRLKSKYPKAQQIRFVSSQLQFEGEAGMRNDVSHSIVGVRLDDADEKWVVQGKSDGLTVSRLTPYRSWSDLVTVVRSLWPIYVAVFNPELVVRLGVRYINIIPLPDGRSIDLDSVLTAAPRVPAGLPQDLAEFMSRVVVPMPDNGIVLTITQAPGAAANGRGAGKSGVVLDIDAACEQTFGPDWTSMWTQLEMLRDAKNEGFFRSLTKPTWEQFL